MISLDRYVLTNISMQDLSYRIRLKDNNEYPVYRDEQGKRFIIINGKQEYLSPEVNEAFQNEKLRYEGYGI